VSDVWCSGPLEYSDIAFDTKTAKTSVSKADELSGNGMHYIRTNFVISLLVTRKGTGKVVPVLN
jgi:hypothetical protein